jgi:cell division septum initiation protein DivIVA
MKSRQRKKLEWERLVDAEKELLNENQKLRQRIVSLETELETLKEIMLKSK